MTVNRRKKNSRQRGTHTHGWGAKKKHRGSGNRGGKGMAGTGKKADQNKPSIWDNVRYFGKFGFKKKNAKTVNAVNLQYFEDNADKLVTEKRIIKEKDLYVIDAKKLGFDKILGCGKLTKRFKITASAFSEGAAEKIRQAGGEVTETGKKEEKEAKEIGKEKTGEKNEGKSRGKTGEKEQNIAYKPAEHKQKKTGEQNNEIKKEE